MLLNFEKRYGNMLWMEDGAGLRFPFRHLFSGVNVNAQPASPNGGDLYIIGPSPTGTDWSGHPNELAYYNGEAWVLEDVTGTGLITDVETWLSYTRNIATGEWETVAGQILSDGGTGTGVTW